MANEIDVHIGRRLREARLTRGMSQQALGEALSISFQQVQKYERGSNRIGGSRLWDISTVLETPISFFFDGLDEKGRTKEMHGLAPDGRLNRRTVELARALNALMDESVKAHLLRLIKAFERIG